MNRRKALGLMAAIPLAPKTLCGLNRDNDYVVNNSHCHGILFTGHNGYIDRNGIKYGDATYHTDNGDFKIVYKDYKSFYQGKEVVISSDIFRKLSPEDKFWIKYANKITFEDLKYAKVSPIIHF